MEAFRRTVTLLGSLYPDAWPASSAMPIPTTPRPVSPRTWACRSWPCSTISPTFSPACSSTAAVRSGCSAWPGTARVTARTARSGAGSSSWSTATARTARRVGHLRPFRLPGGEAAVREPRRSALGLLHDLFGGRGRAPDAAGPGRLGSARTRPRSCARMLDRGVQAPITTSVGRLFDGVAALLGLRTRCTFEGQAAMELEFAADAEPQEEADLIMPIIAPAPGGVWQVDWRPMVASLVQPGATVGLALAASRFHQSLARSAADLAMRVGIETVVLSGGCFQNVRLLNATRRQLQSAGFRVLSHRDLPPNDEGLSAGQALGALWGITSVSSAGSESGVTLSPEALVHRRSASGPQPIPAVKINLSSEAFLHSSMQANADRQFSPSGAPTWPPLRLNRRLVPAQYGH